METAEIPWFLHSFVDPPADPLTVRLLIFVGDLPCIPGPETMGPDNYARVAHAFVKRGWVGFEEEFDRVVPRDRSDYADVKRDLLREPLFDIKAHRHLAEAVLGLNTLEELVREMADRREQQKPQ